MPISISDVVSIQISKPGAALSAYNPNILALLTKDVPTQNYGTGATGTAVIGGGALTGVTLGVGGTGYGSVPPPVSIIGGSGTGALVVANLTAGAVSSFTVVSGGTGYVSAPTVVIGNSFQIYADPIQVGLDFGTNSETYSLANAIFSQSPNPLSAGGYLVIYAMNAGDTLSTALNALGPQLYYGAAIFGGYQPTTNELVAASTLNQAFSPPRMLAAPTSLLADLYGASGMCYQVSQVQNNQTRLLIHTASALQARLFAAAYMALLLSINFNGTNTMLTMNLKQLSGIPADVGINETVKAQCDLIGVDYCAQIGTLAETFSTGGNGYSDNVFGLQWLVGALQVSLFNVLGQTPTKVPQTEAGINQLRSAAVAVLQQGVQNGFLAPGTWTASTFGDPAALIRNITDFGYYVYTQPIAQQAQSQRQQRIAPVMQIAVKFAGAVQKVQGILYFQP